MAKRFGFTLAEILVTLGLIGAVSAMTIPTLAYNYRAKVLEEQFRSTYSDIRTVATMINKDEGDVGVFARNTSFDNWQKGFMSHLSGGNILVDTGYPNVMTKLRELYRNAGTSGPWHFALRNGKKVTLNHPICDNGKIWSDSKGRIWTFNTENRIVCVDINGVANPNRINIDIFAFIPMTAEQVAVWVYDDPENPSNYSADIISCNIERIWSEGKSNTQPSKTKTGEKFVTYEKGSGSALDTCPFNEPIENVAPVGASGTGTSARGRTVTRQDSYWKTYINYK